MKQTLPPSAGAGSRSILNAIAILETFDQEHQRQSLAQISKHLELPKATALRHLRALSGGGYLMYDPATKTYALGPATFTIAQRYLEQYQSLLAGRRLLIALADATGETAHLGVLQGRDVIYLDIAESSQRIRAYVLRGDRLPAHAVASGKAILAYSLPETNAQFLRHELQPLTSHTLTAPDDFRVELQRTRERGFAVNFGEWIEEVGACSAPIFTPSGAVVGAIGVAGPLTRLNASNAERIGSIVREHAEQFTGLFRHEAAA